MKKCLLVLFCFCSVAALCQPSASREKNLQGRMGCGLVTADTASKPRIVLRCGGAPPSANKPLIVLDGEPLENEKLSDLNPNAIESITVLKSANAQALYGSKAAGGVVVVSSKKAKDCKLVVLDAEDSLPVSRASVTVKGSWANVSTASDKNGDVLMPTRLQGKPYALRITNVGYLPFEGEIRFDSSRQTQVVYLKKAYAKLDTVTIVSYGGRGCGRCGWWVKCVRVHNDVSVAATSADVAVSLYPNPVTAGAALTGVVPKGFAGFYQILSAGGQCLQTARLNAQKGQTFRVATGRWPAGVYFLRLTDNETGKSYTQKFTVQ